MVTISAAGPSVWDSESSAITTGAWERSENAANGFDVSTLSTLKHDLRNPLAAIFAFTDLMLRNPGENLTESQIKSLHAVTTSARRMVDLIDHHLTPAVSLPSPFTDDTAIYCDLYGQGAQRD